MTTPNLADTHIPDNILDLPDDQAMEAISAAGEAAQSAPVQVNEPDPAPADPIAPAVSPDPTPASDGNGEGAAADSNNGGEAAGGGKEGEGAEAGKVKEGADTPADPAAPVKPEGDATAVADKVKEAKPDAPVNPSEPKPLASYTAEEKAKAFDDLFGSKLRANGKDIEIRSPEELKRLAQMGCDYTRKLQKLQPKLRAVTMLENNGLLDENQLAFAIDLIKKEPSAIQKLLADAQFDPMSADKEKAADYKPGDHQVSDAEVQFNQALDEVLETSHGSELVTEVTKQWDKESKTWLFQNPELLLTLNQQKSSGIYQQITSEMERLRALGQIPAHVPFLQAYQAIGDSLHKAGQLKGTEAPAVDQEPVETRVAAPAPAVKNDDKAAAAAPTKAAPAAAERDDSGVLGLSDEEFMKQMKGRL